MILFAAPFSPGCRRDNPQKNLSRLERSLNTYDFDGSTPQDLEKICALVKDLGEHKAARAQWICARTALNWYLWTAFVQDETMFCKLAAQLGSSCSDVQDLSAVGLEILHVIESRLEKVRHLDPGGRYDWPARQAIQLIRLQRDKSAQWGVPFLKKIRELSEKGQPVETEARLIVAGAAIHMADILAETPWSRRSELLTKTLGFECPDVSAEDSSPASEQCIPACKEMRKRLIQAPPELRQRLIAAHCPLEHLGFSRREQTLYLSSSGMRIARNIRFINENFKRLLQIDDHPLSALLKGEIKQSIEKWERIGFPIPYPELSPGETGHINLPYSAIAVENILTPLCIVADERRVFVGVLPLLTVEKGETVVLGDREGYRFPGRLVPEPLGVYLPSAVKSARGSWVDLSESTEWKPIGLYLDGDVKGSRLNQILASLAKMGLEEIRLFFRHDRKGIGGLTLQIRTVDPKTFRRNKKLSKEVALFLDSDEMYLTAGDGFLFETPFISQMGDLAGLREQLEKNRRKKREMDTVEIFLTGDVRFLDLSRILVSTMRNSSGRSLYSKVSFVVPGLEKDSPDS